MKFYPIRHSLKAIHRDGFYNIDSVSESDHCILTNKDKEYINLDVEDDTIITCKMARDMGRYKIYLNFKETKHALMQSVGIGIFKNKISIVYIDRFNICYKMNKLNRSRFVRFVVVKPKRVIKLYKYKKEKI